MPRRNKKYGKLSERTHPIYTIVPVKTPALLLNLKPTGMLPFPTLPALTVAFTILEYAGTAKQALELMQVLSHASRAFGYQKKNHLR